ncbi:BCSC C-terminal domain-containing protein [Alcaligenaceae bacterium]|nr:BCSC C-terminal domain-containing protein [Alcaligenaceae bacterium]
MSRYSSQIVLGLLAAALHSAGWAQADASKTLIEQGQFWQERYDTKRATEAWNKLLLISPDNPAALYGLATLDIRAKRLDSARAYLQRLRAAHPGSAIVARLEQDLMLNTDGKVQALDQARKEAAAGELDSAVGKYKEVLQGTAPQGALGREYYTSLGYTEGGLQEAIAGLRRLAQDSPNDARTALALARHLARNEPTRLEGIRKLSALAADTELGADAKKSWREALLWVGPPGPAVQPLFQDYLKRNPGDTAIKQQLDKGIQQSTALAGAKAPRSVVPWRQRTDAAMRLIDGGQLAQAEAELQAVLAEHPNDSEALGGLGIIRMRQKNWAQANELLARASKGNPSGWRNSRNLVEYWHTIDRASALRRAGDLAGARKLLAQAEKLAPKEAAAETMLADMLADEGKLAQAEKAYRNALRRHPGDPDATRGLVTVLAQSNKPDEARKIVQGMSPAALEQAGGVTRMRGLYAAGQAKAALSAGNYASAQASLEEALQSDPSNPWVRLELARLYQRSGYQKEANGLMQGILVSDPNNPEALHAAAIHAVENRDWTTAYNALARVPQQLRTPAMADLYQRSSQHLYIRQAVGMASQGRRAEAASILMHVEANSKGDLATLGALAEAYADIGDPGRALALLRPLRADGKAQNVDGSLLYASILLRTNQMVEASGLIRYLESQALTPEQRNRLDELTTGFMVRQADALRERGDLVAAYDAIAPVLQRNPANREATEALARMYSAAGQGRQALDLYERLLISNQSDAQLHLNAALAGQQAKEYAYALKEAEAAVSLAPQQPEILAGAARIYRSQGKTKEAAQLLERAVAYQGMQGGAPATLASAGGSPSGSLNPFVGMPGQKSASALDMPALYNTLVPTTPLVAGAPAYVPAGGVGPAASLPPAAAPAYAPMPLPTAAMPVGMPPASSYMSGGGMVPAGAPVTDPYHAPQFAAQAPMAGPAPLQGSTLARELADLQQERSATATIGTQFRTRSGDAGMGKLTETQVPLEIKFPAGDGKVTFNATPVILSAGGLGSDLYSRAAFGGGPEVMALAGPDSNKATGVGMSIGYERDGLKLDAGVTPLGFQYKTYTGGALFSGTMDEQRTVAYRLDLSRRPVTDSLTSFAGTEDPRTGMQWGGVSATGARATISKDWGSAGVYGSAGWHSLRGHNVENNHRTEFNAGSFFRVIDDPDSKLMMGVNLNATFFNKNQGHYTYGHGGYFSPKNFYALSLPVTWAQRNGKLTYRLDGALGLQHFKQSDVDMFPTDAGMQARAVNALAGSASPELAGLSNGIYKGESKTGLGYNLRASAEYRVTPQLVMGATIGADNASDYSQWAGGLYMRYYFEPQNRLMDLPVEPFSSPYGATYGR